jgi:hypothetical protein
MYVPVLLEDRMLDTPLLWMASSTSFICFPVES